MRRFHPPLRIVSVFAFAPLMITTACMLPATRATETIPRGSEIRSVAIDSSEAPRAQNGTRSDSGSVNIPADTVRHRNRESKALGYIALATEVTALALIPIAVLSWARILIP